MKFMWRNKLQNKTSACAWKYRGVSLRHYEINNFFAIVAAAFRVEKGAWKLLL